MLFKSHCPIVRLFRVCVWSFSPNNFNNNNANEFNVNNNGNLNNNNVNNSNGVRPVFSLYVF